MTKFRLNRKYTEAIATIVNRSPYFSLLSMTIKDLRWGTSLLEVQLGRKHLQPFGVVQGGVIASVVDAAAYLAVFPQVEEGKGLTTVEMKVNYLAPVRKGKLVVLGRCIKLGKTLALGEAQVKDGKGALVAHGIATLMVVPDLNLPGSEHLPPSRLQSF